MTDEMIRAKPHPVLCGDSIFDNAVYVRRGEHDVLGHLTELLDDRRGATLLAIDGSRTSDMADQFALIPDEATHLFISVGGNDALGKIVLLERDCPSVEEALLVMADVREDFQRDYRGVLEQALLRGLPVTVCTIYFPRYTLQNPERGDVSSERLRDLERKQRWSFAALTLFNDIILLEAIDRCIPVLDLRLVCNEDEDYANAIEPSTIGARKIAEKILDIAASHDFSRRESVIYY